MHSSSSAAGSRRHIVAILEEHLRQFKSKSLFIFGRSKNAIRPCDEEERKDKEEYRRHSHGGGGFISQNKLSHTPTCYTRPASVLWMDMLTDPVCITNIDGCILDCNEYFFQVFGISEGNIFNVISDESRERFREQYSLHEHKIRNVLNCTVQSNMNLQATASTISSKSQRQSGQQQLPSYDWSIGIESNTHVILIAKPSTVPRPTRGSQSSTHVVAADNDYQSSRASSCYSHGIKKPLSLSSPSAAQENPLDDHIADSFAKDQWTLFHARAGLDEEPGSRDHEKIYLLEQKLIASIQNNNKAFSMEVLKLREQSKEHIAAEESRLKAAALHQIIENKRAFLRLMMHEIRSPLNVISLSLERLVPDESNLLSFLKYTCESASDILSNYSLYENLNSSSIPMHFNPQVFNILTLVQEIIDFFKVQAENSNVRLILQSHVSQKTVLVKQDRRALLQAIRNVFYEAFRFTPRESSIIVDLQLIDNMFRIEVQDSGAGIKVELPNLSTFNSYDATNLQSEQGTGLGISLARKVIEFQGGSSGAYLCKEAGKTGTTFFMELPIEVPAAMKAKRGSSTSEGISSRSVSSEAHFHEEYVNNIGNPGLKLLIVDDVTLCRKMLIKSLAPFCDSCTEASNGLEAYETYMKYQNKGIEFDGILMDYSMPVMPGTVASNMIRKAGYKGKILMITGNSLQEDVMCCLEAGADKVFIKPIKPVDTTRILKDLMESRRTIERNQ